MIRSAAAALVLVALPAHAAEMRSIDVNYEDGHYTLVSEVWFDAGIDAIYDVFSRWDLSEQFSSAVVEARDVEADEQGRPGFIVVNRGCVLFFCKTLRREGYVEREPNAVLRSFADPERSDFTVSNEVWEFEQADDGTVVNVHALHEAGLLGAAGDRPIHDPAQAEERRRQGAGSDRGDCAGRRTG